MKQTEFCYWLQGYIELVSLTKPALITLGQAKAIRSHLNLVKACNVSGGTYAPGVEAPLKPLTGFCAWLDGALDVSMALGENQGKGLLPEVCRELLIAKLAAEFLHVIDPETPDPTGALQAAHDGAVVDITQGGNSWGGGNHPVMRC